MALIRDLYFAPFHVNQRVHKKGKGMLEVSRIAGFMNNYPGVVERVKFSIKRPNGEQINFSIEGERVNICR